MKGMWTAAGVCVIFLDFIGFKAYRTVVRIRSGGATQCAQHDANSLFLYKGKGVKHCDFYEQSSSTGDNVSLFAFLSGFVCMYPYICLCTYLTLSHDLGVPSLIHSPPCIFAPMEDGRPYN